MKTKTSMRSTIGTLAIVMPSAAMAHSGHAGQILTFADGLLHPLTGADHAALLAGSGVVLALTQPNLRLSKAAMLGVSGVLAGGFAAMMGNMPFALLGLIGAMLGFGVAGRSSTDVRAPLVVIGTVIAIIAQATSHLLAWGDAPPNFAFAAGFGLSSLGLFSLAGLLTHTFVEGRQLLVSKAQ